MKHILGVYGTLKKGHGNHSLLKDSKLLGTTKVSGFKMFSLGGFPAINKVDDDSTIEIEVYEVDNPDILSRVYRLEGYNGKRNDPSNTFYDTIDAPTKWGDAEMFYFKESLEGERPLVEDGIWQGRNIW